jgi:S1-C subfamily serine protease
MKIGLTHEGKWTMHQMKSITLLVTVGLALGLLACNIPALAPTVAPAAGPTAAPTPTSGEPQPTLAPAKSANELESQVESVYAQHSTSVVNITSRVITYDFFMQAIPQEGSGSGFIYDREGHIVTNYHVVENAESVSVALSGGDVYEATIVGIDPSNDLAALKIEAENLPDPIPFGNSDQLQVGQFVVAIGNPFGLERTLTLGVISSLGRVIQSPDGRFIGEAIQTDAPINPGNSGGPLLDLYGQVIGVNSQIISPSRASAGIGFAVSSNTVARVVPELISQGKYPHPGLGIQVLALSPDILRLLERAGVELATETGLLVTEVVPGGPADSAEIRSGNKAVEILNTRIPVGGDIITAVNGEPVTTFQELTVYLETKTRVGDTIELTLVRDGQQVSVEATLAERPQ